MTRQITHDEDKEGSSEFLTLTAKAISNLHSIGLFVTTAGDQGNDAINHKFLRKDSEGNPVRQGDSFQIDWKKVMNALIEFDPQATSPLRKKQYQNVVKERRALRSKRQNTVQFHPPKREGISFSDIELQYIKDMIEEALNQRFSAIETRITEIEDQIRNFDEHIKEEVTDYLVSQMDMIDTEPNWK